MSRDYFGEDYAGGRASQLRRSSSSPSPAPENKTDVGKFSFDTADPLGSLAKIGSDVFGGIGDMPVVGPVAQGAMGLAGGLGDVGVGGVGVKQTLGVAGDVLGAPERFVESKVGQARVNFATGNANALDWLIRGAVEIPQGPLQLASDFGIKLPGPYGMVQGPSWDTLPADLQARLDQGEKPETIANELASRNAGFGPNPIMNLEESIILDPMNLASMGTGKLFTSAGHFGDIMRGGSAFKSAEDLNSVQRIAGGAYNRLARDLPTGAARTMEKVIGQATNGLYQAHPTLPKLISRGRTALPASAVRNLTDSASTALAQHTTSVLGEEIAKNLDAHVGLIARPGDRAPILKAVYQNSWLDLGRTKELAGRVREVALGHALRPADPATMYDDTIRYYATAADVSEEAARAALAQTKVTLGVWRAAHELFYGRAIAMAKRIPRIIEDRGYALLSPGTMSEGERADLLAEAEQAIGKADRAPVAAAPDELSAVIGTGTTVPVSRPVKEIMDEALARYDDLRQDMRTVALAKKGEATTEDFIAWLRAHAGELPTEVVTTGKNASPEMRKFGETFGPDGYRLALEPESGFKAVHDAQGILPTRWFTPLVDTGLDLTERNVLGKIYDRAFAGIGQARIITEAQDRFVTQGQKFGMTQDESRAVFRAILTEAGKANTTPRAAYAKFYEVFGNVLGESRFAELRRTKALTPEYLVNYAFEGNLGTVGLTQKLTGMAKTAWASAPSKVGVSGSAGNWPVKIAEELYPALKFRLNPLFWGQEIIESPFWNALRGINPMHDEVLSRDVEGLWEALVKNDATRNVYEAGMTTQLAGAVAAGREFGARGKFGRLLSASLPGIEGGIPGYKERQSFLQTMAGLGEEFKASVMRTQPDAWAAMETAYGTTDPKAIARMFAQERLNLAESQKALGFELSKIEQAGKLPDASSETLWEAWKYALKRSSDKAYKTHFFSPERGWLERSLNHPYLGLYPLSYMWGKVVPEFSRFLFLHPLGLDAPLAGYDAYKHVQNAVMTQSQDPEFAKKLAEYKQAIYLVSYMLPSLPNDVAVNGPAWLRHYSQGMSKSPTGYSPKGWRGPKGYQPYSPGVEAQDALSHIGVLNSPRLLTEGLGPALQDLSNWTGNQVGDINTAAALFDATNK